MRGIRFIPENTNVDFVAKRWIAFAVTFVLVVGTILSLTVQGLNLGLDFTGGVAIDARSAEPIDLAEMREALNGLELGEVQLQDFAHANEILIRVQPRDTGEGAGQAAVAAVKQALGPGFEYRQVEVVGPSVSNELLMDGIIATLLAVAGIALYVAFRFEWQFGVSAMIATGHDVLVTVGLFSVLGLDFNLAAIAALLTLAGYSVNDTIVVFDRMREMMRKYKQADLPTIINESVNATLSRTLLTGVTTCLAVLPMLLFGGSTLLNFSAALLWGIAVGTYSSIYVAAALLLYMKPLRTVAAQEQDATVSKGGARA